MLKLLFLIIVAHTLGDYFFQTDYLAMNKGKDKYILFVHCVLYAFSVYVVFGPAINMYMYWIILLLHYPIDLLKANGTTPKMFGAKKALVIDQVLHYIILIVALIA